MKKSALLFFTLLLFCSTVIIAQDNNAVTAEYKVNKQTIKIRSSNRNIQLQSWKEDKVKIVVNGSGGKNESLENAGITVTEMSTSLTVNIGFSKFSSYSGSGSSYSFSNGDPSQTVTINSGVVSTTKNTKALKSKEIIIYVPQSSKINVDCKFGNLSLSNSYNNLDVDITNGNFDVESVGELKLNSKYGNTSIGDVKNGEIEFINGNLSINSIEEGDLDTKYSNIEIGTVKKLTFLSTNDEFDIDDVSELIGRKSYGNLRIAKLAKSIDITGTNADIKVKKIEPTVNLIKIDNKYANLRFPLKNLKDYSVEIKGSYNSIFADEAGADLARQNKTEDEGGLYSVVNGKGTNTKIAVKCQNCTIDLK